MIKQYITEGKIVPMEVTIKLLENAMREAMAADHAANKFLIDGFPRQMDQAIKFDASVSQLASLLVSILSWASGADATCFAGLPVVACSVLGLP